MFTSQVLQYYILQQWHQRSTSIHPGGVTSLSWAPGTVQNGSELHNLVHKLASGGCDNTMKVWRLCNGTWKMDCYPEVQMHSDSERDLASDAKPRMHNSTEPRN